MASHFSNSWFRLNLQQQKILTTLLDGPLNKSGIAKKLNVTSGAIGRSLNTLLDKGLVEMENMQYYVPNSVFIAWLKNEYKMKGVYPFRSI